MYPEHLFNATCVIQRSAQTKDARGAPIQGNYVNHLTGVRCRIQPLSGDEARKYGRLDEEITHGVFVAPGQDIVARDRVTGVVPDEPASVATRSPLDVKFVREYDLAGVLTRLECQESVGWQ